MSALHCKKDKRSCCVAILEHNSLYPFNYPNILIPSSQDHHVLFHYEISLKSRILSFKSSSGWLRQGFFGVTPWVPFFCELKRQVSCRHLPAYNIKTGKDTCYITSYSKWGWGNKRHTEFLAILELSYARVATSFVRQGSVLLPANYLQMLTLFSGLLILASELLT